VSDEDWKSLAGAAEYLQVSKDTLRGYVRRGLIRAFRIRGSRLLRFRRSDLDALLVAVPVSESGQAETRLKVVR